METSAVYTVSVPAPRFKAPSGPVSTYCPCPPNMLERINLRYLYSPDGRSCKVLCPNHADGNEPNLAIYPTNAFCFACSFYETAFQHIERVVGTRSLAETIKVALQLMEEHERPRSAPASNPINPSLAHRYREELEGSIDLQVYLSTRYGLGAAVQRAAMLGYSEAVKAFTIPVFDLDGSLANIRFRAHSPSSPMKYWGIEGHNSCRWYYSPSILAARGPNVLSQRVRRVWADRGKVGKRTLFIAEGEFDALALDTMGVPAISSVAGARSLLGKSDNVEAMLKALRGLDILVAYDQDKPGRDASDALLAVLRERGLNAHVLEWPRDYGKDASELLSSGVSLGKFRTLCHIAKKVVGNNIDTLDTA